MNKFESSVKNIPFAQQRVYDKLSDLSNLQSVKDRLPEDKISNMTFDADHVSFDAPGMGQIELEVVERTPAKCIKFASIHSPIPFNVWIQLVPVTDNECKIRITAGLEVNAFMKAMVAKPIKEGLEKMVEMLSMIQY